MLHRHLDHQRFTLAAIDDVISRGGGGSGRNCAGRLCPTAPCWTRWSARVALTLLTPTRNPITSGCTMPKNTAPLPDWELVLSCAARLQRILPDAVLVGGTASAIHAEHRFSRDAD